jgi:hypothetical protein
VRSTRTLTLSQAVAEPGRFRACSFVFSSFESSSSLVAELEGQDHSAANVEGSIGAAIPFSPNPNNDHPTPNMNTRAKMPSRPRGDDAFWHGEGVLPSDSPPLVLQRTPVRLLLYPLVLSDRILIAQSPGTLSGNNELHGAQGQRLHKALIQNPSSGDNELHRSLC